MGDGMTADRAATIRGLRQLADFLERNPDVPISSTTFNIIAPNGHDNTAVVEAAAEAMQVGVHTQRHSVEAGRRFAGDVTYTVYTMRSEWSKRSAAMDSYRENVRVSV